MVQDSASRKLDQYIVRFPDGMRDRLKDEAAKNKRSLNAEIIARLEDSFLSEQLTIVANESAFKPPTARELKRVAEIMVILERNALDEQQEDKLESDYEKAAANPRVKKPKP